MTQGRWFKPAVTGISLLGLMRFFAYSFRPRPLPVDLATVSRAPLAITIDEDGYTRVRNVYLLSAPVTGHLLRIDAEVGDAVSADASVVARMSPGDPSLLDRRSQQQAEAAVTSAEATLDLARAQLRKAHSQAEYARSDLVRARDLAADNNLSASELEQVELAARTAQAGRETAQAAVRLRQAELANARALLAPVAARGRPLAQLELRAPASGRVLRILQRGEGLVAAGTPLLEIGDPAELEIVTDLLSRDAVAVPEGAPVRITGWGGEQSLEGRVRRIEPLGFTRVSALGIEEQRVNVLIDLLSPHGDWARLGHGFRVEASILTWQGDDVLQVPTAALFRQQGRWAVLVPEAGVARLRPVSIGRQNGRQAQVLEGLSNGEQVIVHPSERVEDGARVVEREG